MLNFAKVRLCGAVALILAFSGAPAHAGLSTNCLATDGSKASLLLQIKKNKKHSGQSQNDSGLTNCTIVQPGGGGGCKGGFKYVCEKMKSGDKCCGCVPTQDSTAKGTEPEKDTQAKTWVDTQKKAEERFSVGTDVVPPAQ